MKKGDEVLLQKHKKRRGSKAGKQQTMSGVARRKLERHRMD